MARAMFARFMKGSPPVITISLMDGDCCDMRNRFFDIRRGGVGFVAGILVFAETEPAVDRAAHVEQKDDPVLVHLLEQPLVKLADPGVGVPGVVQFLDKGQILIGHVAGHPHLADRVHGQPDRVGIDNRLDVGPIGLRDMEVGHLFQLIGIFNGYKCVAGQDDFQNRHEHQVGHFDTVDGNLSVAVGGCQLG